MDYSNLFPKVLFSYLIKIYLKNIILVLLIFLLLVFLVDFIEIYRRASEKVNFNNNNDNFISILIYLSFLFIELSNAITLLRGKTTILPLLED